MNGKLCFIKDNVIKVQHHNGTLEERVCDDKCLCTVNGTGCAVSALKVGDVVECAGQPCTMVTATREIHAKAAETQHERDSSQFFQNPHHLPAGPGQQPSVYPTGPAADKARSDKVKAEDAAPYATSQYPGESNEAYQTRLHQSGEAGKPASPQYHGESDADYHTRLHSESHSPQRRFQP